MILSEEQTLIRDMARNFARDRIAPQAAQWEKDETIPTAIRAEMADLGLMGALVPEAYDGADVGHVAYTLALAEIAAGDGALSTLLAVHNSVGCMPILRYGSEDQKQTWLKPLARGEKLAAFALSEPHTGSDAGAIRCRARREGNKYILNGTKQFITSGQTADLVITFAVTDPDAGKKGLSAFIVPTDTPGFAVSGLEKKLGQKASDTAQLTFTDMVLTPDLLLGAEGAGYKIALANLEGGRIGIAAQSVGMAQAAFNAARDYARDRETFGTAIANHQAVAFKLADMATKIEAGRLMYLRAAALRDAGMSCLKEASMAKLFASEMAEEVCSAAIQIHGGYGYSEEFPVAKIYRDVRVTQIYEGTSEIQRLVIARALLAE